MINNLLTEDQLLSMDEKLARDLAQDTSIRWESVEPQVRQAYARYVAFSDLHLREKMGLSEMTALNSFYNAYYWINVFSKRYQEYYGSNAGVEQQVFKVLEAAPPDVDWGSVEKIANMAKR